MTSGSHPIPDFGIAEGSIIACRYELAERLGSGKRTIVFRAVDFLSGDEVAVKAFRTKALHSPAALETFKREH